MLPIVRHLTEGRDEFLDAVASAREFGENASAGGWSVLKCVEHVVLAETRHLQWLEQGRRVPTFRDPEKETGLFSVVRSRLEPIEAPEPLRPKGEFADLDAALEAFREVRGRVIRRAGSGEELYQIEANHPYFGPLNGAEWMQVIDAHSRRHTEQIQEIAEQAHAAAPGPPVKKPARRGKSGAKHKPTKPKLPEFRRDVPDLASELPNCGREALLPEGNGIELEECELRDATLPAGKLARLRLEGVVLERIEFSGCELGSMVWKDVRLVGCDLANVLAHRVAWVRVELIDCRLTGFTAREIDWQDVLVRGGDLRFAQLAGGKFRNSEFDAANLEEADFQDADLAGCKLHACSLVRTDLHRSRLEKTDLRGSAVEEMLLDAGDLRGAIVDPAQAMVFARLLGLEIG